ncbi:MAG: archease [Candidatus Binatia bacterium]|nr:archease [Candidatus Binatia bacterium]
MPFRWLEDAPISDAGFEAWGTTLDECFHSAADALLALMVANPEAVEPRETRAFTVEHDDLDLLLVRFLEEILYYKDAEQLLLRVVRCAVAADAIPRRASAELAGERADRERHLLSADVKAVTLHRLSVHQEDGRWVATVVVDL